MKKLTIAFAVLLCSSLNESFSQSAPYKAAYTSSFEMGNATYANKVLDLWKDWDDNQFSRHQDYFADTVVMFSPDGSVTRGKAENMAAANKFRGNFSKVISTVHAWVPLHSTDLGDNVVCIWGTELDTYADGKEEKRDLHEVWWFNKDGKVSVIRQWASKFGE